MCRIHYYIIFFSLFFILKSSGQSLTSSGPNSYEIASSTFVDATTITSHESNPTGMEFGDSGMKFYTVGSSGDFVIQHNLSAAYDLSTITGIDEFISITSEESQPHDVTFNNTGSKMYITGDNGNDITEFDLSTNWDVSTATVNDIFDFEAEVFAFDGTSANRPQGIVFNDDGTKLYVLDRARDRVYEFDLTTAYDVSTATTGGVINELNVNSFESNPRGLAFNNDGSELYITGANGDEVNVFTFTSGNEYDLSAASHSTFHSVFSEETAPQDIVFNSDGSKFFIIGSNSDEVHEYDLTMNFDFPSGFTLVTDYKVLSFDRTPQDVLFNNDGTKMYVVGDSFNKVAQYSLATTYDVSSSTFEDSYNVNSEESNPRGMTFNNDGSKFYIIGTSGDEVNEYSLSTNYDLTSTVTHLGAFSVASDDNNPTSITFNNDGTVLFVLGNDTVTTSNNDVIVYNLSPGYDLTDIALGPAGRFSLTSEENAAFGMDFSADGNLLFIAANQGNEVLKYSLTAPYDVLSVMPTLEERFSVNTQDATPTGIAFNPSGSKFFVSGNTGDDINEYFTKGTYSEETASNNGTILDPTSLVFTLTGDTFADLDADNLLDTPSEFTITNLPEGLTPVLTLSSGDTVATLTFSTVASSHLDANDVDNLLFSFTDAAFTSSTTSDLGAEDLPLMSVDFIDCPSDIVYNGSWSGGSGVGGAPNTSDTTKGIRIEADVTLATNVDCFCVHVESGNTLSVATGLELNVSDAVELVGDLRLLGTSQLKQTHSGVKNVPGTGNLYKDVKGTLTNVYQIGFWSSPVTTNGSTYTISGVLKDGTTALTASNTPPDILFVDGVDGNTSPVTLSRRWLYSFINASTWDTQVSETSDTFNPAEGFNKKSTGEVTGQNYTFVGQPNGGDYTSTIGPFGSGRWSLLGNPYPSPIDADTFLADNSTAIEGTLYFYEAGDDGSHNSSSYNGGYATRISGMGNPATDLGGIGTKVPDDNIGIGQGFFVEASATGGTVTFNNNQRVFDVSGASTEFFSKTVAKKKSGFPILRLGFEFLLNDKVFHRPVAIGFRGATENYEWGFEAEMWDLNPTDLALQVLNKEEPFSIIGIQSFHNDLRIPITIQADEDRMISLMVDELKNIESTVFIYDSLIGMYYNITEDKVAISLKQGTYKDRFFITFSENNTLGINEDDFDNVSITSNQNHIEIQSKTAKIKNVIIYNTLGQEISNFTNSTNEISIEKDNYRKGLYLITILTEKGTFTKKIMIN
jgi:6-phosphogluconolactonase (cycloisomerase 2 family)